VPRLADELAFALELADAADRIAASAFGAPVEVARKHDGTPVSEIDRRIEETIRDRVHRRRPGDGFLGEEFPEHPGGPYRWVLDPIDGTRQFLRREAAFATILGLEHEGRVIVGVVSAPVLGVRWWAARGGPAYRREADAEPTAVSVSTNDRLDDATVLLLSRRRVERHGMVGAPSSAGAVGRLERAGVGLRRPAASWETVRVADGSADGAVTGGWLWDVTPQTVIVTAAGGSAVILPSLRRPNRAGIVLTNGRLESPISALLGIDG
jgi:histidinol-phosphatase